MNVNRTTGHGEVFEALANFKPMGRYSQIMEHVTD